MTQQEPGDRPAANTPRPGRELERPPGERYVRAADGGRAEQGETATGSARPGSVLLAPLARASAAATLGALLLYALGALLSSSVGLLFVAGLTGAAVGLLIARAAAPGRGEMPALGRRGAMWVALALSLAAVGFGAVGTWLHALAEGGALGFVDYLGETFGAIVPLEVVVAAVAAAWGAGAGPVEG